MPRGKKFTAEQITGKLRMAAARPRRNPVRQQAASSRSTGFQPVPVPSDASRTACAAAVQAQRREAWGEPSQGAASSVVRPRPHGRPAFTCRALEREDQV